MKVGNILGNRKSLGSMNWFRKGLSHPNYEISSLFELSSGLFKDKSGLFKFNSCLFEAGSVLFEVRLVSPRG